MDGFYIPGLTPLPDSYGFGSMIKHGRLLNMQKNN